MPLTAVGFPPAPAVELVQAAVVSRAVVLFALKMVVCPVAAEAKNTSAKAAHPTQRKTRRSWSRFWRK